MTRIVVERDAWKALNKLTRKARARVEAKIEQLADDPAALANTVTKLRNRPGYRLRIGQDRLIFDREGDTLRVLDFGPRGSIYR